MNSLVMGALALIAVVIIAMALSGTNKTVATFVQAGLVIAILAVLIRDAGNKNVLFGTKDNPGAITRLTNMAIGTSGK